VTAIKQREERAKLTERRGIRTGERNNDTRMNSNAVTSARARIASSIEKARAVPIEREIERRGIKLRGRVERVGPCPVCGGTDRFSVNTTKGVWNCRGCEKGGDVIELTMHLDGSDFKTAVATLAGEPPAVAKPNGKGSAKDRRTKAKKVQVAEFPYHDEAGNVLFVVERFELQGADGGFVLKDDKCDKTFAQKRPDPDLPGQWNYDVKGVRVVLYRLPELIEAVANGRTICIPEGEAKVDLLQSWNVPATCNAGGAGKWKAEHSEYLRGADVVVVADNDQKGRQHAEQVAASLHDIAASIRMLELPGLAPKGDIIDWHEAGGTVEQLHALIASEARTWSPAADDGAHEPPGVSLDDFFAYMPQHAYIFAPSRELWPAASVNARLPPIIVGDKPVAPAKWLDQNRPVEQMSWIPGGPQLIEDRLISDGGLIERPGCRTFNLYRPPNIAPAAGDIAPWLELMRKVFPHEADHIVRWLAHRVQHPHEKINHALVLGGKPGIGKDTILEPVKQAVGPWNFQDVSPKQVLGRFNGFLKATILRVNEARDLGEFDRYAFHDHMKVYIAAPPDVLRVDEKNLREYYILNLCGVIITTNHKTDGIYLAADDRRHMVAWSNLSDTDFTAGSWRDIYGWYANGGNERVAHYLGNVDLSGFDPKAPPTKTQAFWEIVNVNRAPEDTELADVLDQLGRPDVLTLDQVANQAALMQPAFAEWLRDRKNRRNIPHRFEDTSPSPTRTTPRGAGRSEAPATLSTARPSSQCTTASPRPSSLPGHVETMLGSDAGSHLFRDEHVSAPCRLILSFGRLALRRALSRTVASLFRSDDAFNSLSPARIPRLILYRRRHESLQRMEGRQGREGRDPLSALVQPFYHLPHHRSRTAHARSNTDGKPRPSRPPRPERNSVMRQLPHDPDRPPCPGDRPPAGCRPVTRTSISITPDLQSR
jgi:hypothetical protein